MGYFFFEKHKGSEENGGALFRGLKEDKHLSNICFLKEKKAKTRYSIPSTLFPTIKRTFIPLHTHTLLFFFTFVKIQTSMLQNVLLLFNNSHFFFYFTIYAPQKPIFSLKIEKEKKYTGKESTSKKSFASFKT